MIRAGKPARAIAAALGGAVSATTVGRRAAALLGARRVRGPKTASAGPSGAAQVSEPADVAADLDLPGMVAELGRGAAEARLAGNLALFASMRRLQLSAIALEAKLNPPPPPPLEESPSMIAAAERCRAKLHDYVGRKARRMAEARASAPKCPACEQPIMPELVGAP